jgi:hypothetical protein
MLLGAHAERTLAEWFLAAAEFYLVHQGCAACGSQHCVFQSNWGARTEFFCSACDFSACHDADTGQYFASEGDGRQLAEALLGRRDEFEDDFVGGPRTG